MTQCWQTSGADVHFCCQHDNITQLTLCHN